METNSDHNPILVRKISKQIEVSRGGYISKYDIATNIIYTIEVVTGPSRTEVKIKQDNDEIGFDHSEKNVFKSGSKGAYLVQNFSLIIFLKSILVYLVPPTHKLAKTAENRQNDPFLGSVFARLGPKSEKPYDQKNRLFLMILEHLSV